VQFDDAVWAVGELKQHGLDLADMSLGMNTDDLRDPPFSQAASWWSAATASVASAASR
jgi:hypothetical protein